MILEAVWLKNGEEVEWVDPVRSVDVSGESISDIIVTNDYYSYFAGDETLRSDVDGFLIRIKS